MSGTKAETSPSLSYRAALSIARYQSVNLNCVLTTNFDRSELFTATLDYTADVIPYKLGLAVEKLQRLKNANQRAVVFVRADSTAIVDGLLRFKDPHSRADVLITSFDMRLFGKPFEDVCSHATMLEYPHMFADIIDAKNALGPVGSTDVINWDFMHMSGTLGTFHLFQLSKQQAEIFASEATFVPGIHEKLRLIVGYEVVRADVGYEASYYPRSRVH
ncbi:hypothetical protein Neosp_006844 [[Neocosmospora] mangrovei]